FSKRTPQRWHLKNRFLFVSEVGGMPSPLHKGQFFNVAILIRRKRKNFEKSYYVSFLLKSFRKRTSIHSRLFSCLANDSCLDSLVRETFQPSILDHNIHSGIVGYKLYTSN